MNNTTQTEAYNTAYGKFSEHETETVKAGEGRNMTSEELKQLRYLNREIEKDTEHLNRLRSLAYNPSGTNLTGMPKGGSHENRLERYAVEISDLEKIISANIEKCLYEQKRLNQYIADIPNSYLRQVFTLYFINGLTWNQVALSIGGTTADAARMACRRYIDKTNK